MTNDIPKYKKKSQKKGRPRADHKHEYITAIMKHPYYYLGEPRVSYSKLTECKSCGRIKECYHPWRDDEQLMLKKMFESGKYKRYVTSSWDPRDRVEYKEVDRNEI